MNETGFLQKDGTVFSGLPNPCKAVLLRAMSNDAYYYHLAYKGSVFHNSDNLLHKSKISDPRKSIPSTGIKELAKMVVSFPEMISKV